MRFIHIASIVCLLAFAACNNSNNTPANKPAAVNTEPPHSKLGDTTTQGLMQVVSKYYVLKNALVATKAPRVDSAATVLAKTAEDFQAALQKDSVNMTALKINMDSIIGNTKVINTIKDGTCEKQRMAFEVISRNMYAILKKVDLKNGHVYHQYCPMAFNEKGAYWLSGENEILNPYFGKKMLECGEVTDSM